MYSVPLLQLKDISGMDSRKPIYDKCKNISLDLSIQAAEFIREHLS